MKNIAVLAPNNERFYYWWKNQIPGTKYHYVRYASDARGKQFDAIIILPGFWDTKEAHETIESVKIHCPNCPDEVESKEDIPSIQL